ncbi:MAG: hypothetical protein PHC75_09855, partial [Burkholderiales bacterium]|nr:hypothetical protein [Burkholderiales bacterium]
SFVLYIGVIVEEIGHAINKFDSDTVRYGTVHLNMLRSYRRMISKNMMRGSMKATVNLRNIQFVLNHLFLLDKDEEFWLSIRDHLKLYQHSIKNKQICLLYTTTKNIDHDYSEVYVVDKLNKSIKSWNKLCELI